MAATLNHSILDSKKQATCRLSIRLVDTRYVRKLTSGLQNRRLSRQLRSRPIAMMMVPGKKICSSISSPQSRRLNSKGEDMGEDIDPSLFYNHQPPEVSPLQQPQGQIPQPDFTPSRSRLRLFSGTANKGLSQEVADYLGLELGDVKIKRFADGEIYVQIEESIRGCDVFLCQPTCPPANDHLMELLIMIDACRRASPRSITAVIPYFGYARADRKASGRESIAAKLVANLITEAGANRVLALDLHSAQCVGYFDIPVDHVYGQVVVLDYLASRVGGSKDMVVVSPDVGGVARARAFAKKLSDAPLAIIDKRRTGHNQAEVMNLIGDVEGKTCIMVDDMIDTAGTLVSGAELLHKMGAKEVLACATHAVFSPPAVERLSSGLFQEVIVTNSIPSVQAFPELTVLSIANLMGETIWRVHTETSVQNIFKNTP